MKGGHKADRLSFAAQDGRPKEDRTEDGHRAKALSTSVGRFDFSKFDEGSG